MNGFNEFERNSIISKSVKSIIKTINSLVSSSEHGCVSKCSQEATLDAFREIQKENLIIDTIKSKLMRSRITSLPQNKINDLAQAVLHELLSVYKLDFQRDREVSELMKRESQDMEQIKQALGYQPNVLEFGSPDLGLEPGVEREIPLGLSIEGASKVNVIEDPSGKGLEIQILDLGKSDNTLVVHEGCRAGFTGRTVKQGGKIISTCEKKRGNL